jgi:hypothetical protein
MFTEVNVEAVQLTNDVVLQAKKHEKQSAGVGLISRSETLFNFDHDRYTTGYQTESHHLLSDKLQTRNYRTVILADISPVLKLKH